MQRNPTSATWADPGRFDSSRLRFPGAFVVVESEVFWCRARSDPEWKFEVDTAKPTLYQIRRGWNVKNGTILPPPSLLYLI